MNEKWNWPAFLTGKWNLPVFPAEWPHLIVYQSQLCHRFVPFCGKFCNVCVPFLINFWWFLIAEQRVHILTTVMSRGHSLVNISTIEAANASTIVSYRPYIDLENVLLGSLKPSQLHCWNPHQKLLKIAKTRLSKSNRNYRSISNAVQNVCHFKGHSAGPFRTHTETVPKSPAACCGHDFNMNCVRRFKG